MDKLWICTRCMRVTSGPVCEHCGGAAAPQHSRAGDALPPQTILAGKYMVGGVVGCGGFGITYRAVELENQRRIAIKEYFPRAVATRGEKNWVQLNNTNTNYIRWRDKFVEEYRLLFALRDCEACVTVLDVFYENNTAYLVMEFVEGETLEQRVARSGPVEADTVLDWFRKMLPELSKMHQHNILHRDINPANIMLPPDGCPVLIDFGSARVRPKNANAHLSELVRPGFAPPEQYHSNGRQGAWTDVYGMCATMYFALTGFMPPDAVRREKEDVLLPCLWDVRQDVPLPLAQALMRGMNLEPAMRQKDFVELEREIFSMLSEETDPQPPQPENTSTSVSSSQPESASPDSGNLLRRRIDTMRRAARLRWVINSIRQEWLKSRLDEIAALPSAEQAWERLERLTGEAGKLFAVLVALMTPRR